MRTLVLLAVEALVVWTSLVLGILLRNPEGRWLILHNEGWLLAKNELFIEGGYLKILLITGLVLLLSHWLDRYDESILGTPADYLRMLVVLALVLGTMGIAFPSFLPGDGPALGFVFLILALFAWRALYGWLVKQPYLRERVYVLGMGDRAERVVEGLRKRKELGIEVVGWAGNLPGEVTRESVGEHLVGLARASGVHRVIVAMPDRRGTLPVDELLGLRLAGVKVEEATSWLEKIYGRIEVEQLYPSWLIFAEGFRFSLFFRMVRRVLNFVVALVGLAVCLPLIPFIMLAVKLSSPGPALYKQKRVGRGGAPFYCYKFRTMVQDAEADTGATWALDDDPRITRVGKILRVLRLDEIPQLWCVLKGDMNFVGPRPERPEFVEWLSREIPYYGVRHAVRPGITGWAQVQYKYGNTLEDAREKLQYDLFYIKNASLGLDVLIWFQTVKIVVLGRGAQ